jgi:uncharacterized paraquat-inducible protein A
MNTEDYHDSLIDCPECNRSIDEDSEMCPSCGYFVMEQDRRPANGLFQTNRRLFQAIAIVLIFAFTVPFVSRAIEFVWEIISVQFDGS